MKVVLAIVVAGSLALGQAVHAQDIGQVSNQTKGTSMAGTSMKGTSMKGTSMTGTSMKGSSMAGSSMKGSSMKGSSMTGTSMRGTSMKSFSMNSSGEAENVPRTREVDPKTALTPTDAHKDATLQATNVPCNNEPVANPAPLSIFILSDGSRVESGCYLLTMDSLRLQDGQKQRTIPLSAIDLNATVAANRERGLDLKIPANKAEITLGF